MTERPSFQLARLREIGWAKWDPIGLGAPEHGWPADEYDSYLLQAAGQIWNGESDEEVADYLVRVETKHMGLDAEPGIHSRALEVAKTLRDYVESAQG